MLFNRGFGFGFKLKNSKFKYSNVSLKFMAGLKLKSVIDEMNEIEQFFFHSSLL